jgi:hypothetical protein
MISIPEWVVVAVIGAIGVVVWWGILRLVRANDKTGECLNSINESLVAMCGKIEKHDMWIMHHEKQDDDRHEAISEELSRMRYYRGPNIK